MISKHTFPQRLTLWHGSVLGTIAHAIWVAANPDFSHEQSWDGPNYSIQDSMGSRGTISFKENQIVGVFFDRNSPRNPFKSSKEYNLSSFLNGIPSDLLSIANGEALQYLLQEYNGVVRPIITVAFWSQGDYLTAAEPWPQVFDHGAHLVRIQLKDTESGIAEWKTQYEMLPSQVELTRSLFYRWMTSSSNKILLNDREQNVLLAKGTEGLDESRELLAAIGIILP